MAGARVQSFLTHIYFQFENWNYKTDFLHPPPHPFQPHQSRVRNNVLSFYFLLLPLNTHTHITLSLETGRPARVVKRVVVVVSLASFSFCVLGLFLFLFFLVVLLLVVHLRLCRKFSRAPRRGHVICITRPIRRRSTFTHTRRA